MERKTFEEYMPLARHLAKRFQGAGIEYEDLVSIGFLGLTRAWNEYDSDRYPFSFTTFAFKYIKRELWVATDKQRAKKRAHEFVEYRDELLKPGRKSEIEVIWELRDLINGLPRKQKQAIILWLKGYTPTEISVLMGYSLITTADAVRRRAVKNIQMNMDRNVKLSCFQCMATFKYRPKIFDSTKFCSRDCREAYAEETLNQIVMPFIGGDSMRCKHCDAVISEQAPAGSGLCDHCRKASDAE